MDKTKQVTTWHNSSIAITRVLGRHPRLVGRVVGVALALAIAVSFVLVAVHLKVEQAEEGHAQVLSSMQALQADTSKLLTTLNASFLSDCSPENLNQLRGLLFAHRYARSIGLLDVQGRLFCTTSAGLLKTPAPRREGGIDGAIGRYHLNTPVQIFNGAVHGAATATVVERGSFQVMTDNSGTRDTFEQYADSVWAGGGNQRRWVFKGKQGDTSDALVLPDTPHLRVDWRHARLLVTTTSPGVSPISVQSVLRAAELSTEQGIMFAGLLGLCGLLGFLTCDAVTRRCRYFRSMDFRIHHLCKPANVVCHYQPILELASGRMVGCEVLARLQDGQSLIYPEEFISALTKQGLTWTFDAAVSRQALQELGDSLPGHGGFTVALNFFPQNLRRDTVHPHLQSALRDIARHDLRIELEVTEYDFSPEIVPELRRLKADGYFISLDDFGTGYSNLGMVKRVAPDYLKIDKSFVFEMGDDTIRSSLIPEIIAIAKAVGSEVIAEGIETAAQAAQLKALGVRYGQGYHFARPMALADFKACLRAHGLAGMASDRSAHAALEPLAGVP